MIYPRSDSLHVCPYTGQYIAGLWRHGVTGSYFVVLSLGYDRKFHLPSFPSVARHVSRRRINRHCVRRYATAATFRH